MNLTRKQELALINLGMQQLLKTLEGGSDNYVHNTGGNKKGFIPWNKGKKTARRWTAERRAKFSATMKKKWANRDK